MKLILCANANTQTGTCHVMRGLALSQAWQDAGDAANFTAVDLPEGLEMSLMVESTAPY